MQAVIVTMSSGRETIDILRETMWHVSVTMSIVNLALGIVNLTPGIVSLTTLLVRLTTIISRKTLLIVSVQCSLSDKHSALLRGSAFRLFHFWPVFMRLWISSNAQDIQL